MGILDNGLEAFDAGQRRGDRRALPSLLHTADRYLDADDLVVAVRPFTAQCDHKVEAMGGRLVVCQAGVTIPTSEKAWTAVVAYYNPVIDSFLVIAVDGATGASPAKVTDAQIVAALPNAAYPYTVLGQVQFTVNGSDVVTDVQFDHAARSHGVVADEKYTSTTQVGDNGANQLYAFAERLEASLDAADIADGVIIAGREVRFRGRVAALEIVCEKAITTAAKTTDFVVKIGSTVVVFDPADNTYAATKAIGVVTGFDPAFDGTEDFMPGDSISITAANTTAFGEGRVKIALLLERIVD